jgi:tetratricopeptide (TPR) repeat protein
MNEENRNKAKFPWPWAVCLACVAVVVLGILAPRRMLTIPKTAKEGTEPELRQTASIARQAWQRTRPPPATPDEIVAGKVDKFARDRLRIARAMAKRIGAELPPEVDQFFNAVAAGHWQELNALYHKLENLRDSGGNDKLRNLWGPILETLLIAECAHAWPAQKLLEYGQATLGALTPGMVYVGGTDPGRGIPTLLNETSEGEHHIVLTQNALADGTYLDYIRFLYGAQMQLPTEEETRQAFNDYIADAQKRFEHDRQFPDEPKQVRPGERIWSVSNSGADASAGPSSEIQVSGNVAVMSINERILQTIMDKNPGMSFAMEESFPLASTYSSAVPLGPLMQLRAPDGQNSFTLDTAGDTLQYWRNTADQLEGDTDAPEGSEVRKTYSHMAVAQANLMTDHHYDSEAEQTYRLAMEMEPSNPEAVYGLANLLNKSGRLDEARQLVDDFSQSHPDQKPPPQSAFIISR